MAKKKQAPVSGAYFSKQIIKKDGKNITKYRNSKGQFVAAEKVEKSNIPVYQFRKGELIIPKKQEAKNDFVAPKNYFEAQMFFSSVRPAVIKGLQNGEKIAIKANGNIFEITANDIPYFESFLSDYFRAAKRIAAKYGTYAIVQINFVEGDGRQLFNFDNYELMDEDMKDELIEDDDDIRNYNLMTGQITKVKTKYYNAENKLEARRGKSPAANKKSSKRKKGL